VKLSEIGLSATFHPGRQVQDDRPHCHRPQAPRTPQRQGARRPKNLCLCLTRQTVAQPPRGSPPA